MRNVSLVAPVRGLPLWYQRHSLTAVLVTEQVRVSESPKMGVCDTREVKRTGATEGGREGEGRKVSWKGTESGKEHLSQVIHVRLHMQLPMMCIHTCTYLHGVGVSGCAVLPRTVSVAE